MALKQTHKLVKSRATRFGRPGKYGHGVDLTKTAQGRHKHKRSHKFTHKAGHKWGRGRRY